MLFLSAQPDQTYFIWQLEIQLRNFHANRINKENIQVLVGYNQENGLNEAFKRFIDENIQFANFHVYPDRRENPRYTSSIRPNLLKQHFQMYPKLERETIFYHDSDILLSRLPQISNVDINNICYVSDTRNYLDVDYIRQSGSEELLDNMLDIIGLSKEKLEQEDTNTGGLNIS